LRRIRELKRIIAITIVNIVFITMGLLPIQDTYAQNTMDEYNEVLNSYMDIIKYDEYNKNYDKDNLPNKEYIIDADKFKDYSNMDIEILEDYQGMKGKSVFTGEEGFVKYELYIEEEGFYNISFLYYPVEGKSSAIQRAIFIDGKLPFSEANNIEFDRIWIDKQGEALKDNQGNDLRPSQVESPIWLEKVVQDYQGYHTTPFKFYLSKGMHSLSIVSRREPMVLRNIKIYQEKEVLTYEEKLEEYKNNGYKETHNQFITIEAEKPSSKSSQMLYPTMEHSSPAVTPYSPKVYLNNTMGGSNWRDAGQWVQWEVDVPESGLYKVAFNAKQNFIRGIYSSRKLYIDGKVPFKEMEEIPFRYKKDWRVEVLGGDEPYLFYLEEGKHTIRMEVVLGELSSVIREVEIGVRNLNEIYRQFLSITGTTPDRYRDYQIEKNLPGIVDAINTERDRVDKVINDLERMAGKISDREVGLITMRDELNALSKDVETITRRLNQFKQNIGSMGTWMTQAIEQPLQLDQIYIISPSEKPPKLKDSFWNKLLHELKTLYYSFVIDYNAIGNVAKEKEQKAITVWIGTGRDQANTIKSLIDEDFTKNTGINVNLMLVDINTLLPATLSGQGPDVAMQVWNDIPMNYGMRNAVTDLSKFEGFDEVAERFYGSAMIPYMFEDRCFALPEQQTFNMLFYRKDILKELGLETPKTWDEVKVALSVLSKNQMAFGLLPTGYFNKDQIGMIPVSEAVFGIFLYQNGGEFYNENATASGLSSDSSIQAFKDFTEYYTDFKLEREFDPVSRFRTGEMPLMVSDYTTYNTLQVSAPEIKGLWGFTSVPGTVLKDGTIKYDVPSTGTACIMMENSKNKEASWEFMKWWTDAKVQIGFGREMEGLMGSAARYPTANIEAFSSLPWPVEHYKALDEQFKNVRGVPQVPGGYFTTRHINNAFYEVVVNENNAPREALMDYVRYINDEIEYKRKEFGLTQ